MGTESLQRHLYKERTKIQNVKPNKTIASAENIRSPVFGGPFPVHNIILVRG